MAGVQMNGGMGSEYQGGSAVGANVQSQVILSSETLGYVLLLRSLLQRNVYTRKSSFLVLWTITPEVILKVS
jgi:hypothetical protein